MCGMLTCCVYLWVKIEIPHSFTYSVFTYGALTQDSHLSALAYMFFFLGHKKLSTTLSISCGVSIAASRRGIMKGQQPQHDENAVRGDRRGDNGARADALRVGGRWRRPHIRGSGAGAREVVAVVEKELLTLMWHLLALRLPLHTRPLPCSPPLTFPRPRTPRLAPPRTPCLAPHRMTRQVVVT